MILTDYYKGEKLTEAQSRFDITASTGEYDLFESLLVNKRKFNIGGLSFNFAPQPETHGGKRVDFILCKGCHSITKVFRPNLENNLAYGDINGSNDGCVMVFNPDYKQNGITTIELFIARGLRSDKDGLWFQFADGYLAHEVEALRKRAVTKKVTGKGKENDQGTTLV
jgi:hypothetical protein